MRNETRVLFNQFLAQVGKLNGVEDVSKKFNVTPSVQQTLETKIQESSTFLGQINIIPVTEQKGENLGLGIGSTIAGRTDTSVADRQPTDPSALTGSGYEVSQTNFDTAIKFSKLDLWAKFPDFQIRLRNAIIQRQALDRIMIGFNGTSRAATTNRVNNPLLQDVNKGWLQRYRDLAAQRVMTGGATANQLKIGAAGDYHNLDALVMDMVSSLIDPWHRDDTKLIVLCGSGLMADKYFPLVNQTQANSEKVAADIIISQKRMGGLQAASVPFFPAGKLMVTTLENLSLYYQEGARRRSVVENAKRDQIENYESSNEDYVIEDLGAGAVAENIVVL